MSEVENDYSLQKLKLPTFNGEQSSWTMWKRLVKAKLLAYGLCPVIAGNEEPVDLDNSKVYYILLEACYNGKASPIMKLVPEGNGRTLWKKLVEKYEGTDLMRMMNMLKTLINLIPKEGGDPAVYFASVEELRDSIENWYQVAMNAPSSTDSNGNRRRMTRAASSNEENPPPKFLNDLFLVGLVLSNMGEEYDIILSQINQDYTGRELNDLNLEYIQDIIIQRYKWTKGKDEASDSLQLKAKPLLYTEGAFCHFCKEEGHVVSKCPKLKKTKCNKCGELGHTTKFCKSVSFVGNLDDDTSEQMHFVL